MNNAEIDFTKYTLPVKRANTFIDLHGRKFGRITVLKLLGFVEGSPHIRWLCKCDCGTVKAIIGQKLRTGTTTSCGCFNREQMGNLSRTHGGTGTREYLVWKHIKARCLNPNEPEYLHYGGRGIKVCEEWVKNFPQFLKDMGPRPSVKHSIERKNNNGNYEAGNCHWALPLEQANNKRNNRFMEFRGQRKTVHQWCRELGLNPATVRSRIYLYGWSDEKALTAPIQQHRRNHMPASL